MAAVTINATGDDPELPPLATVIANDSTASIVRDTATLLGLTVSFVNCASSAAGCNDGR